MSDVAPTLDAEMLATLHTSGFDDSWSAVFFGALLSQPGVFALATPAQNPAGFILVRIAADEAEVLTLTVLPAQRQRGFGKALIESAIAVMATHSVARCFLEVAVDNTAAIALYMSTGFATCGRRREYYQRGSGHVDAIMMERMVQPSAPAPR